MLTGKQMANVYTVALVFDMVSDPVRYALSGHGEKPGKSLSALAANSLADMSIAERTAFFEKFLDKLTPVEREAFRYYVGHGCFKEDSHG